MTTKELSDEFDVLLNSFSNTSQFGQELSGRTLALDEYEKSVLLTQAQSDLVTELYNGTSIGIGFEQTEELREYLKPLIKVANLNTTTEVMNIASSPYSKFYTFPPDILYITKEDIAIGAVAPYKKIVVKPITQDKIHYVLNNPFKGLSANRALRVEANTASVYAEVISNQVIHAYNITYLKRPSPIILTSLGTLSINGISVQTESELQHPFLQREILKRAVNSAIQRMGVQTNK